MDSIARKKFNNEFTEERYRFFLDDISKSAGTKIPFRIAETPVFISSDILQNLLNAGKDIISQLLLPANIQRSLEAVPDVCKVPGANGKPTMLALDFALVFDERKNLVPRLVELQGFPSLYYYQDMLADKYKEAFPDFSQWSHLFMDEAIWKVKMKDLILGGYHPDDVVLMELDPRNQNTYIDFLQTARHTGIDIVCISELFVENSFVYRIKNGVNRKVHRIYNRVIFDELKKRPELLKGFHPTAPVEVEWVCHPDWYFRISKHTLPYLDSEFVPHTIFANDSAVKLLELSDYVLKPLYSFSGSGVELDVDLKMISGLANPSQYILQRKIEYASCILTPDGYAKVEIRMMYAWFEEDDQPTPVITLARISKGAMVGVKYNQNQTWVGSSVGLWESKTKIF
ncbi:MAG: hypothetical protein ACKO0X_02215 [Bacteroidota bacterium]